MPSRARLYLVQAPGRVSTARTWYEAHRVAVTAASFYGAPDPRFDTGERCGVASKEFLERLAPFFSVAGMQAMVRLLIRFDPSARNVPNLERNVANATIRRRGRARWRSPGRVPSPAAGQPRTYTCRLRRFAPGKAAETQRSLAPSHKLTVGNPTGETGAIASRISGSDLRSRTDD
jgi:hypothetical protein